MKMPIRGIALCFAVAGGLSAQTAMSTPGSGSSISGRVSFAVSNVPAADVDVAARSGGATVRAKTDAQGNYTLKDVIPGAVNVVASAPSQQVGPPVSAQRRIQLGQAQDLIAIDFRLPTPPQIRGRVIDENKEPVPGMFVMLIAREYSHGALRYVFSSIAIADDQGNYSMGRVDAGREYLLLARPRPVRVEAISNLPDDPAMRKRLPASTYYPGTSAIEAAQPIALRDGEIREGVDIQMIRAPSLCMEGHTLAGANPGSLEFGISPERPTYGTSGNGGMYGQEPYFGKTGADGLIRACGLTPGTYTIRVNQTAEQRAPPAFYGTAQFTLTDADLRDVAVSARPLVPVSIEAVLDGPAPIVPSGSAPPPQPTFNASLQSLVRSQYGGEKRGGQLTIPGTLQLDGVLTDDYFLATFTVPPNLYVKDATYGDVSILRGLVRVGNAPADAALKITFGQDAGFVQATVTDKDNVPVADSWVTVFPANAITEADIAVTFVSGQTDQLGGWKTPALAAGKYFVLATAVAPDRSPESIAKLISARTQLDAIEIAPGATVNATIVPRAAE